MSIYLPSASILSPLNKPKLKLQTEARAWHTTLFFHHMYPGMLLHPFHPICLFFSSLNHLANLSVTKKCKTLSPFTFPNVVFVISCPFIFIALLLCISYSHSMPLIIKETCSNSTPKKKSMTQQLIGIWFIYDHHHIPFIHNENAQKHK